MFQELSSSPATMPAGKALDAYGLLEGNAIEQADAVQSYTQALLQGHDTWIRLPRDRWPDSSFKDGNKRKDPKYHDPVVKLRLALYGHPDSGGH